MSAAEVLAVNAGGIAMLMLVVWAVSVAIGNASIVDIVWGFGFAAVAALTLVTADGYPARQVLLTVLTAIWGLRLAGYLLHRNHGQGEDFRYRSMRQRAPGSFAWRSLWLVFGLQGALMWTVSLPVQLGQVPDERGAFVVMAPLGGAVWALGMAFETIGDWQLTRFKADPRNEGQVMDTGLWRYSRHPNYFGDFCVWWGLFLIAASSPLGLVSVFGPIVMTVLLLRVSGVAMLERSLRKRKPAYEEYAARTNAFFPGPPKAAR